MNWEMVFRGSTTVLLLGGFAALVVEAILGTSTNKRKRFWIWICGMICLMIARLGIDYLEMFVESHLFENTQERGIRWFIYSTVDNGIGFLLPPVVVLICTLIAYEISTSVKIFISTFAGFWACILHEYPFELMRLPFLGGDRGDGLRERPALWLNTVLLVLCMVIFYWLFRRFLCSYFRKIIEITNGDLRSFVLVPLLCSIVLMSLLSVIEGNNIEITSIDKYNMWMFIVTVGVLIFLFILLYWALFRGLTLSTEAMAAKTELDVARNIQTTILPATFPAFPQRKEFDIYAKMMPAKEIGGDFYDFYLVDSNHIAVCMADVSGKSVPAALYMMTARTLLKSLMLSKEAPERAMMIANDRLCTNNEAGMFVTVWLGLLEIDTGRLQFVNAGHNPPLLWSQSRWQYMDHEKWKSGLVLGACENMPYECNEIFLTPGDFLVLYTDGITEATNQKNELWGEERLLECVTESRTENPKDLIDSIIDHANTFVGDAEQFDDMTLLALQITD